MLGPRGRGRGVARGAGAGPWRTPQPPPLGAFPRPLPARCPLLGRIQAGTWGRPPPVLGGRHRPGCSPASCASLSLPSPRPRCKMGPMTHLAASVSPSAPRCMGDPKNAVGWGAARRRHGDRYGRRTDAHSRHRLHAPRSQVGCHPEVGPFPKPNDTWGPSLACLRNADPQIQAKDIVEEAGCKTLSQPKCLPRFPRPGAQTPVYSRSFTRQTLIKHSCLPAPAARTMESQEEQEACDGM